MTIQEQKEAARQFYYKWQNKGKEDEDDQSFWIDIFQKLFGVENATDRLNFQKKVFVNGNTKRIDAYVTDKNIIIEQKSRGIALDKKIHNSGDIDLTPYEQAKRYNDNLPHSEKARYIVTSNFAEIWVYDMEQRDPEADIQKISIENLQTELYRLEFLVKDEAAKITKEETVSKQAGEIVGILYDELYKNYKEENKEEALRSLNILCVRLVFCMYAEDAGLFGKKDMFHDYLINVEPKKMRRALKDLFRILNTPDNERDADEDEDLLQFPYVNGGLFSEKEILIPQFTDELKDILLNKASNDFDWSDISPTIFGAIFESTLNPETRRSIGAHYTSIENLHKIIDNLFLNDLRAEFEEIKQRKNVGGSRTKALKQFQNKIASIILFDPACGSGNFGTESYISLRKLENLVLKEIMKGDVTEGQMTLNLSGVAEELLDIKVSIQQFYGIEINDFAVTVAKTALWIAEAQMMQETLSFADINVAFLPLKSYTNIVEGNALRIDWNDVLPADKCTYLMSNPPFIGRRYRTSEQIEDVSKFFNYKDIDYVACWYKVAAKYMKKNPSIETAFVSTNSICQGEQVSALWKELLLEDNIYINFAFKTFIWDSEASVKAHVYCIIVGFSFKNNIGNKYIYENNNKIPVNNINGYLIDADNIFIENRSTPLCDVPVMKNGNVPLDGDALKIEASDIDRFKGCKYIKKLIGGRELLYNEDRYVLWLVNASPSEIRNDNRIMERVELCRENRLKMKDKTSQKLADRPTQFRDTNNPNNFIALPMVSGERRRYIPMAYFDGNTIPTNQVQIIPDATLYHLGVLESNVHMAWMRVVCGRLKGDYRYSKDIVYNNFPWPNPTPDQKQKIEKTAQGILDARALYPDSSLADLYDPLTMPPELSKAHTANDIAVMQAYGFNIKETSEADCVAHLMEMYKELTENK